MKRPLTLTSGQLLDIIAVLEEKENAHYDSENGALAAYYMQMGVVFQKAFDRLQDLPGEQRIVEIAIPTTEF
jgi:hypothetical protein